MAETKLTYSRNKSEKPCRQTDEKSSGAQPSPDVEALRNSRAVRWYILTLPYGHRGGARGLREEQQNRIRYGEPTFEYFAPTYQAVTRRGNSWVKSDRPLLYNYVFVHASENEIYRMMRAGLSVYSFLPRVRDGLSGHYPYLTDEAMENLRWVAQSYADEVPICYPSEERLEKGDRVLITGGRFKGIEATVVAQPNSGKKSLVVCVEDWMCVPLLEVTTDQYRVISFKQEDTRMYARLNNDRLMGHLHEALGRVINGSTTEDDRKLAAETLREYEHIRVNSDVMRCKLAAFLLPAYTIVEKRELAERWIGILRGMMPGLTAEQSRALVLVTLYGCTNSSIFYHELHGLVAPWRKEPQPKKSKQHILQRLEDYDRWYGHE